jgi:DNA-binding transcriptional LysR family regulator
VTDEVEVPTPDARERMRSAIHHRVARRRRIRNGVIAGGVALVVAGSGIGAASVVLAPPEVRQRQVACYPSTDPGAQPQGAQRDPHDTVDDAAGYAVQSCRLLWTMGIMRSGTTTAPSLQLCVQNDGTLSVFPVDAARAADSNVEFCDALGLQADPRAS